MPFREMLEEYPLYRKFTVELPQVLSNLKLPAVTMHCPNEKSLQTFNSNRQFHEVQVHGPNTHCWNRVIHLEYQCASCGQFLRHFFIDVASSGENVKKVGQVPPWDITLDPELEKALGDQSNLYKRGLISESQAYGIGAFAYYRRIIEEIIDALLNDIETLLAGDDKVKYSAALQETKKTKVAKDKIDLVKDLLPPILRPDGMNPLAVLHGTLSKGIHEESDETCIELAATTREVLIFLVNQVSASKSAGSKFTESMRKLLDRKKNGAVKPSPEATGDP